jgi:hypothetical protein
MDGSDGNITTSLNVFLAHSPFQYFVASHMIDSMPEFRSARGCLVVDRVWGGQEPDRASWDDVIDLMPPVGGSVLGAGRRMRAALRRVMTVVHTADRVRLFVTNVQWPLNNVAHATLTTENSRRSVEVCNYPEGIGSLRLIYPTVGQRWRDRVKGALRVFGGVAYRPIKRDLMGLEQCDHVYSFWPHLLSNRVRSKAVLIPPFPAPSAPAELHTCVFLGQNDRLVSAGQRRPAAEATAAYCRRLPYDRFLYKPHHYGQSEAQRRAFLEAGFEEIDDCRPVEQMLMARPVACVASFNSSALVHLKMMYGERVRCIACLPDIFGQLARNRADQKNTVRGLFEQSGVEIVDHITL